MINKRILVVAGTRPEVIKLFPVYAALLKTKGMDVAWLSTGQHREMLRDMYDFFSLRPDFDLNLMTENQTLAELSGKLLESCSKVFVAEKPDIVIVQGDTTTAMVAALAAFYLGCKVVHVEAGLRSYDKYSPFPEEGNRRVISAIADVHFAPTRRAKDALMSEKAPGKIFEVGNTVIDALAFASRIVTDNAKAGKYDNWKSVIGSFQKMVLITCHRRENFGSGIQSICRAIQRLARAFPHFCFVYPVHLNPKVNQPVQEMLVGLPNVIVTGPVSYDTMIYLMQNSYFILTDSGGIQEEAPSLKKPVLVMRETTERPEGIEMGCSKLVGVKEMKIFKSAALLINNHAEYKKMIKRHSPYGNGKSGTRIATILSRLSGLTK